MTRSFRSKAYLLLAFLFWCNGAAVAAIDSGAVMLFTPLGVACPSPCTSGVTTVTIDSVGTVGMVDTIELSISTELSAPDAPDPDAPVMRLDFDLVGRTTDIHFIEHVTNTGTVLWEEWAQTAAPFHWDPTFFPLLTFGPVLTGPMSIEWANQTASVAGTSDLFLLPEIGLLDDPVLGQVNIPADTIAGAVFNFGTLLGQNQSATIEKDLVFNLLSTDPSESGVVQVAVGFLPAAVPIPAPFLLLLSALAGLPLFRRRA